VPRIWCSGAPDRVWYTGSEGQLPPGFRLRLLQPPRFVILEQPRQTKIGENPAPDQATGAAIGLVDGEVDALDRSTAAGDTPRYWSCSAIESLPAVLNALGLDPGPIFRNLEKSVRLWFASRRGSPYVPRSTRIELHDPNWSVSAYTPDQSWPKRVLALVQGSDRRVKSPHARRPMLSRSAPSAAFRTGSSG
jgi:hypothetical protein